jgi:uncharacterized membrane-anchored protein YjiN (DUF445 family)
MTGGTRNRLGSIFLIAALAGFIAVEFQPWLPFASIGLFGKLSLKALLEAFFEASLAGAFADWFAVSALFKDPLGIRLPHTNILAKNKDAIAEAIPRFLTGFVSMDAIKEELGKIDYAAKAAEALTGGGTREELHSLLKSRAAELLSSYGGGDDAKTAALRRFVDDVLAFAADRIDAPGAVSALLAWARKERLDQKALEAIAEYARAEIARNRRTLVAIITPIVKRNAGWQGLFIGSGTIERFLEGIQEELSDIKADKTNEFRLFLLSSLSAYAAKVAPGNPGPGQGAAPERSGLAMAFRGALAGGEFRRGFALFAAQLLSSLGEDLSGEDGRLIPTLLRAEEAVAARLAKDDPLRARLNALVASFIAGVIDRGRIVEGVTEYLAGLLRSTDERAFVERIEASVWNDLQYIRVNGSVVGGLVGLAIATVKAALGG